VLTGRRIAEMAGDGRLASSTSGNIQVVDKRHVLWEEGKPRDAEEGRGRGMMHHAYEMSYIRLVKHAPCAHGLRDRCILRMHTCKHPHLFHALLTSLADEKNFIIFLPHSRRMEMVKYGRRLERDVNFILDLTIFEIA